MFKFLKPIRRYFFPPRKLHRIPAHISAEYERGEISRAQQIIMMAGLARDPDQAQQVYQELRNQYGEDVWDYVRLEVRRQRTGTFYDRMLKLFQRVAGEQERLSSRVTPDDARVLIDYQFND